MKLIHSRFRIIDQLARGGQSEIYIVHDQKYDQMSILKVYLAEQQMDIDSLRLLAENLCKLNHPSILPIVEMIIEQPKCCLLPFVKGKTLMAKLRQEGKFEYRKVGRFVAQIVNVVDYLHHHKVWHRDIKPDNFLVGADQRLYLSDFDFACFNLNWWSKWFLPKSIRNQGTAYYMAPEHLKGSIPHSGMDVYAVATTVYQLLTGKYPFGEQLPARFQSSNYIPIDNLNRKQNEVLRQALAPNPSYRLRSVTKLYRGIWG